MLSREVSRGVSEAIEHGRALAATLTRLESLLALSSAELESTSSPTPSAGSGGAGSGRATTGLTREQSLRVAELVEAHLLGAGGSVTAAARAHDAVRWVLWSREYEDCATGGADTPAPLWGVPPVSVPGGYCAATSRPAPSAPTPTVTPIDWSVPLRTAVELRCGMYDLWERHPTDALSYLLWLTESLERWLDAHCGTTT